jgi:hypothetical protein
MKCGLLVVCNHGGMGNRREMNIECEINNGREMEEEAEMGKLL